MKRLLVLSLIILTHAANMFGGQYYTLVSAEYGTAKHRASVTENLMNIGEISRGAGFTFKGGRGSSNQLFGDPAVNEVKTLYMTFRTPSGITYTQEIPEDQPFKLGGGAFTADDYNR